MRSEMESDILRVLVTEEELKARIADLRQSQTCPACGAPCGKGDKFCRACGRQL